MDRNLGKLGGIAERRKALQEGFEVGSFLLSATSVPENPNFGTLATPLRARGSRLAARRPPRSVTNSRRLMGSLRCAKDRTLAHLWARSVAPSPIAEQVVGCLRYS